MAHATEFSGPDFSVGIPLSELIENVPFIGHAQAQHGSNLLRLLELQSTSRLSW